MKDRELILILNDHLLLRSDAFEAGVSSVNRGETFNPDAYGDALSQASYELGRLFTIERRQC